MTDNPWDETPRSGFFSWTRRGGETERRAREYAWQLEQQIEMLKKERADLRGILASLGEGVLAVDATGVVLHANPVAIQLLGISPDTTIGSHLFVAVSNQRVCAVIEEVMRADMADLEDSPNRSLELHDQISDRVISIIVAPLRTAKRAANADGSTGGAIAVIRDVSALRRSEQARRDFFANVSHELKTPITTIRASLETILDDADEMPTEVRTRFLKGALRHASRLTTLVNDLLTLSRIEHEPGKLNYRPVDLFTLTTEILDSVEERAERAGVKLLFNGEPLASAAAPTDADADAHAHGDEAFVATCDEEAIRQALSNLVDNAVEHSPEGEAVSVDLRRKGRQLEFSVHNHGPAIPRDLQKRIFERFFRIDDARSRELGGSGIGLSIVKHVANAHNGSVAVRSSDKGSRFYFRLPNR